MSEKSLPPTGFAAPDWAALADEWKRQIDKDGEARNEVLSFPASEVQLGHEDADIADDATPFDPNHAFGWDNEAGVRLVAGEFDGHVLIQLLLIHSWPPVSGIPDRSLADFQHSILKVLARV